MRTIRPLQESDFPALTQIAVLAFPDIFPDLSPERLEGITKSMFTRHSENPGVTYYGAFEGEALVGGMRIHDYAMNVFGEMLPALGVGMVVVSLAHKKQHVAYDMLQFFLQQAVEKKALFTILYPFRPDFYRQMGFGYGTQKHCYRIQPQHLPRHTPQGSVQILHEFDGIKACYERLLPRTHGLVALTPGDLENALKNPNKTLVGCLREGEVRGFMEIQFKPTHQSSMVRMNMQVSDLFYEDRDAFLSLMDFLHRQADQVDRVELLTFEEDFFFLPFDPREDSLDMLYELYQVTQRSGVGLMYRLMDIPAIFHRLENHHFGSANLILRISIRDSFFPQNSGSTLVAFQNGKAQLLTPEEVIPEEIVEISLDISDFSSLLLGVVEFRKLYTFGLAELSDESKLEEVQAVFHSPVKPVCITMF